MNGIQLMRADSGADMEKKVAAELRKGWDLYGPLVTAHKFALGQWLVRSYAYHEYRLVDAQSFAELEQSVLSLEADGFDLFHFTADWNGHMYQWMARAKEREFGYQVSTVVSSVPMVSGIEPTVRLIPNILAGAPPLVVEDGQVVPFDSPSET